MLSLVGHSSWAWWYEVALFTRFSNWKCVTVVPPWWKPPIKIMVRPSQEFSAETRQKQNTSSETKTYMLYNSLTNFSFIEGVTRAPWEGVFSVRYVHSARGKGTRPDRKYFGKAWLCHPNSVTFRWQRHQTRNISGKHVSVTHDFQVTQAPDQKGKHDSVTHDFQVAKAPDQNYFGKASNGVPSFDEFMKF